MRHWRSVSLAALGLVSGLEAQIVGGRWETLREFDGSTAGDGLGWAVAGPGDLDGDGRDDVVLGAPFTTVGGAASVGSVFAYSGADGTLLWRADGVKFGDQLGKALAAAGDVDADGRPDVIAGAPQADPNGRGVAGTAYVYSGRDGRVLWQFDGGAAGNMLGSAVAGSVDVNADGHADLLVGAPEAAPGGQQNAGLAHAHSGADGPLLWRFQGTAWVGALGRPPSWAAACAGDGRAAHARDELERDFHARAGLSDPGSGFDLRPRRPHRVIDHHRDDAHPRLFGAQIGHCGRRHLHQLGAVLMDRIEHAHFDGVATPATRAATAAARHPPRRGAHG